MTEALLAVIALLLGMICAISLIGRRGHAASATAPLQSGYTLTRPVVRSRIPYYPLPVPEEATHVAFVMMGTAEHGQVYSLAVQSIAEAEKEVKSARAYCDPAIQKAIELEDDLTARGCETRGDVRFCLVQIDRDGNERWWSGRRWVPRWHKEAALFDIWGERA